MLIKKEKIVVTNSKPHRSTKICLELDWDTRIGEWVLRDNHLFCNNYSLEVLEDMINIIKIKSKEK